jgi:hypothetical protein
MRNILQPADLIFNNKSFTTIDGEIPYSIRLDYVIYSIRASEFLKQHVELEKILLNYIENCFYVSFYLKGYEPKNSIVNEEMAITCNNRTYNLIYFED